MKSVVRFVQEGTPVKGVSTCDFNGKLGDFAATTSGTVRILSVGLGKTVTLEALREGIHTAMSHLKKTKTDRAIVELPHRVVRGKSSACGINLESNKPTDPLKLAVQWCHSSLYDFDSLRSTKRLKPTKLSFVSNGVALPSATVRQGEAIAAAVNTARTLGNSRPQQCSPEFLADFACRMAKNNRVRVVDRLKMSQLQSRGLNLLAAVGQGAVRPPTLVVLEYRGNATSDESTAIVGKGITMDTGGLNIKAFGSMETMHMDMMGAAAVIGTTQAVAALRLPVNLVSVLALAENAVGPEAVMPSSVIKSLKGTTVEITNTDAEGRLVLADALTYVQKHAKLQTKVSNIVDIATLTGACVTALGNSRAGLFSNDEALIKRLMKAGETTLEPLWPLPIDTDHRQKMKGVLSDLINCTPDRYAGACTAAAFLEHFIEPRVKWAHLDIAGPGMGTKATKTHPAGAPGFGVSLMVNYFEKLARK